MQQAGDVVVYLIARSEFDFAMLGGTQLETIQRELSAAGLPGLGHIDYTGVMFTCLDR